MSREEKVDVAEAAPVAEAAAVPRLRFPGEAGAESQPWMATSLGDLYEFTSTNSLSRADLTHQGGQILNLHYGDIHVKLPPWVRLGSADLSWVCRAKEAAVLRQKALSPGDVVLADASEDMADIGKAVEIIDVGDTPAVAGLHTIHASPRAGKELARGFAAYLLRSEAVRRQICRQAHGTKVLGLTPPRVGRVEVLVPCVTEQRKIASFIGAVDLKLDTLRQQKDALARFKTGLMQKLFSQETRFTREDGSAFPEWTTATVAELFDFHPTNSLSRADLASEAEGEYLNVHYGDIHTRLPQLLDLKRPRLPSIRPEKTYLAVRQRPLGRGDIVLADASEDLADVGKAVEILHTGDKPVVAGLHTIHASPKADRALAPGFAAYLFGSPAVRRCIEVEAHGTKVAGISTTRLGRVSMRIPDVAEQEKIVGALSSLDDKIAAVADQITQMEIFKKGLLQQMFV